MGKYKQDPVLQAFNPVEIEADGLSIYNFLGIATRVRYNKDWVKFAPPAGARRTQGLPIVNELYLDWVAVLESVLRAKGSYRIVELGAGWGAWTSAALAACRQRSVITDEGAIALEADRTHYSFMKEHFENNDLISESVSLIHGALGTENEEIAFPLIENPDENYYASLRYIKKDQATVMVPQYTLENIFGHLSGSIDLLHMDVQCSEYDVLPPNMELVKEKVKAIFVGTHISSEHHHSMVALFRDHGWRIRMDYDHEKSSETPYGWVNFDDGVLLAENPIFIPGDV